MRVGVLNVFAASPLSRPLAHTPANSAVEEREKTEITSLLLVIVSAGKYMWIPLIPKLKSWLIVAVVDGSRTWIPLTQARVVMSPAGVQPTPAVVKSEPLRKEASRSRLSLV